MQTAHATGRMPLHAEVFPEGEEGSSDGGIPQWVKNYRETSSASPLEEASEGGHVCLSVVLLRGDVLWNSSQERKNVLLPF